MTATTAAAPVLKANVRVENNYGTPKYESCDVLDAHGRPIHKGELVRVIGDHQWTHVGQIIRATGATSDGTSRFSVQYETHDRHSSGIAATKVEVAEDEQTLREFKIASARSRLTSLDERIQKLNAERYAVEQELRNLQPDA